MAQRHALLSTGLAGLCCCTPQDFPGTYLWEGERVEVWTSDSLEPCGGSLSYLDAHAQRLITLAEEHDVPSQAFARYRWLDEYDWESTPCAATETGCTTLESGVFSRFIPHTHESVHALLREDDHPSPFLSEGLATVYGDDHQSKIRLPDRVDVRELLALKSRSLDKELYTSAALFVRVLLDFAPDRALRAILSTRKGMSFDEHRRLFAEHGIDLDEVIARFDSAEVCPEDGIRIPLAECGIEPIAWVSPDRWEAGISVDCQAPGVMNDAIDGGSGQTRWTVRALEVDEPGYFNLELDPKGDVAVRLGRCDQPLCGPASESWEDPVFTALSGSTFMELAPGRYWLRVLWPADLPYDSVRVSLVETEAPWE